MGSATLLSDAHPGNCFTLPLHHHLALPTHSARRSHLAHRHLLPGCHHEKISTSSEPLNLLPMSSSYLQLPPHTVTANLCHSCHTFIPTLSLSRLWPQFSTSQFENSSQPSRPTSTKFYLEQSLLCACKCEHVPYDQKKPPPTNGFPTPAVLTLHIACGRQNRPGARVNQRIGEQQRAGEPLSPTPGIRIILSLCPRLPLPKCTFSSPQNAQIMNNLSSLFL